MSFLLIHYFDLSFIKTRYTFKLTILFGGFFVNLSARQTHSDNLRERYPTNTTVALAQTFGRCVDGAPLW